MFCRAREYFLALVGQAPRRVSASDLDQIAEPLRKPFDCRSMPPYLRWFVDPVLLAFRLGWRIVETPPGNTYVGQPGELVVAQGETVQHTDLNVLELMCERSMHSACPVYTRADVVALAGTLAVSRSHAAEVDLPTIITLQPSLPEDVVMGCWNAARVRAPGPGPTAIRVPSKKRIAN